MANLCGADLLDADTETDHALGSTVMPWPGTFPWVEKTAAELRPLIIALCNAVNDRRECIGLNRNAWTVNTDQSIYSLTVGTKSTALVEDDLYGLDIFRYNWWGLIAGQIYTLVNLRNIEIDISSSLANGFGGTQCGGWSKTDDGTGHGSGLWTLAELETEVGLGTLYQSAIGGSTMHLFDEVAPNRFREMLDRLIYPVIFPWNAGDATRDWDSLGFGDEVDAEAASSKSSDFETTGDAAWGSAAGASIMDSFSGYVAGICLLRGGPPFTEVRVGKKTLAYLFLDFGASQNGAGCLGTIVKQIICFGAKCASLTAASVELLGSGTEFSGTNLSGVYQDITDADPIPALTGIVAVPFSMATDDGAGSPFYGTSGLVTDVGNVWIVPVFMFQTTTIFTTLGVGSFDRGETTRLILDITAHCSDQT